MKFGVWYDLRNPPQWHQPYAELYRETLAQIVWAESAASNRSRSRNTT